MTEGQQTVIAYIKKCQSAGYTPAYTEIASYYGCSTENIRRIMKWLIENKYVDRQGRQKLKILREV